MLRKKAVINRTQEGGLLARTNLLKKDWKKVKRPVL